jgi:hypothetical protein
MSTSPPKFSFSYNFVLVLILLTSCFQNKNKEEKIDFESSNPEAGELINYVGNGLNKLKPWVSHWQKSSSTFNPQDFKMSRTLSFDSLEYPEEVPYSQNSVFYNNLIRNPQNKGVVDIYGYKIVIPENDIPYFNADSEVAYFKNDGMRERLLFIGPSGGFEDAVWVSDVFLLVAGFFEEEEGVSPKLWLINTETKTYFEFKHDLVIPNYVKESYLREKFKVAQF